MLQTNVSLGAGDICVESATVSVRCISSGSCSGGRRLDYLDLGAVLVDHLVHNAIGHAGQIAPQGLGNLLELGPKMIWLRFRVRFVTEPEER